MTDDLLRNRLLSLVVVMAMISSSLAGLIVIGTSPATQGLETSQLPNGDLIIGSDYEIDELTIAGTVHYMDGNLTIKKGGILILESSELSFTQDTGPDGIPGTMDDRVFTFTVEDGGQLIVRDSTITTHLDLIYDFPSLGFIAQHGAYIEVNDSTMRFPGFIVVDNSTLVMRNSVIEGHPQDDIASYCNETAFPSVAFDDAPVMLLVSSDVYIFESRVNDIFEGQVSSLIYPSIYNHHYSFVSDDSNRIEATYNLTRNPSELGAGNDCVGEVLENLTMDDSLLFTVDPGQTLGIDKIDVSGLQFDDTTIEKVTLHVKYKTDPGYAGTGAFQWGYENSGMTATSITPADTAAPYNTSINEQVIGSAVLPDMSETDLNLLNITFNNNDVGGKNVYVNRIWVSVEFSVNAYRNLTSMGSTALTAANSFFDVDFSDDSDIHNNMVMLDNANAYLYGVYFDYNDTASSPSNRQPAVICTDSSFISKPLAKSPTDDTGQPIVNLLSVDTSYYVIQNGETMAIDQFNTSDFSGAIADAYLKIIYSTQPGFTGIDYIQYGLEGQALQNTSIGISNSGTPVTAEFNLFEAGIGNVEDISNLNVTLLNTGGADIDVQALWIEVEISPAVYIYRWLNLTAFDSQNLPVGGAVVNATLLPAGVPANYYTPDGVQDAPPDCILEYLGKDTTSFKETGPAGIAYLPLLIEMVNEASMPNSFIIGSYDLNITYTNATDVSFYASGQPIFSVYPAMDEADAEDAVTVVLSDLMLDKPDLVVSSIELDTEPIYDDDDVQISITINNTGLTAATNFTVVLTDFHSDATIEIFNTTIGTLEGGDSVVVVADWSSPEAGTHILTATADPDHNVIEAREDNNELSHQVVVLAQLPDLSVTTDGISFTPQPAYTDTEVILRAVISNVHGRASAINTSVEFYAGNPDSGGTKIGTASVNVPVGGSNSTQVIWIPSQIGVFPIYVVVNGDRAIEEYSYDNNTAFRNITVDLSVGPQDIVLGDDDTLTLSRITFNQVGNIIVMDNAELILDEAVLNVVQEFDNQFQVLLEDSGILTMINSTLTSNHKLRVYLFDDSSIIVDPSEIGSQITLEMNNNSSLIVTDSIVNADIVATPTSNAMILAVNSTFTRVWSGFGGSSVAYLTSINAPALVAKEDAVIIHYRWLEILVLDGTGAPLAGAYVEADYYYNGTYYSYGVSGEDGLYLFQCLCDRITSDGFQFYGTYRINATYWYDGERYDSEIDTPVSFDPYSPPVYRDDLEADIQISSALPDLDPPFHVSDLNPARREAVALQANVSNIGVVPANSVLVRFKDNDAIIEDVVVTRINPGETAYVNVTWIAAYPLGWHNLSVVVDPYGNIPEINKTNNMNYTWVDVRGIPDLIIEAGDISFNPPSPTTNTSAVITVRVANDGDVSATNVNVSVYDTPPTGTPTFVGYAIIPEIFPNATTQTTITWTPNIPGNHTITVIVDEDGLIEEARDDNNEVIIEVLVKDYADLVPIDVEFSPAGQVEVGHMLEIEVDVRNDGESTANNVVVRFWVGDPATGEIIDEVIIPQIMSSETEAAIGVWQANTSNYQKMETRTIFIQVNPDHTIMETNYSNDNTSATINVIDYRPDLSFTEPVRVLGNGQAVDNASVGDIVNIVTTVKNDGLNSVLGVEVWLYAIDNDSYIVDIARVSLDISAEGTAFVNETWVINASVGYNNIAAWVNFDKSIEERRYDNDNISTGFNVTPPQPLIVIDLGGITNYKPDTNVFVRGTITNEISDQPLPGLTVTTSLTDVLGNQIGDASTTSTTSTGYFETLVYIPPGLERGDYMIKVEVEISGAAYFNTQQIYVEPIFEESSIPWWVWLIIIVVVAAVIIGFSLYLYKYGLGKMVECGECGSLIPENSKKCPKCGVLFETGTAKCSECGAWIPASANVCPECGAKFIGEAIGEEEDEYIKKMREQYDSMLDDERSRAKEEIGKKYSEAKFIAWWKKQPNYVSFESWLSEEEEKRKSGAFPCPVCSTLNPRGSSICHKCGTLFETKVAEKEEPKKRPLRRIVRRPAGKSKADQAEEGEIGEETESSEEGSETPTGSTDESSESTSDDSKEA